MEEDTLALKEKIDSTDESGLKQYVLGMDKVMKKNLNDARWSHFEALDDSRKISMSMQGKSSYTRGLLMKEYIEISNKASRKLDLIEAIEDERHKRLQVSHKLTTFLPVINKLDANVIGNIFSFIFA